jgi:hypothetical protein
VLARQVLYYLSHSTSPLSHWLFFESGSHFMPRLTWTAILQISRITDLSHCGQPYVEEHFLGIKNKNIPLT